MNYLFFFFFLSGAPPKRGSSDLSAKHPLYCHIWHLLGEKGVLCHNQRKAAVSQKFGPPPLPTHPPAACPFTKCSTICACTVGNQL